MLKADNQSTCNLKIFIDWLKEKISSLLKNSKLPSDTWMYRHFSRR